jgi:predicted acyl esterase
MSQQIDAALTEEALKSETRDGMRIDVPTEIEDGLVLPADVFRPVEEGDYPVILTYGPYAKRRAL